MMISGQIQNQIQKDFHPGADLAPGLHPDPNSDSSAEMQIDETAKQRERGAYRRNRETKRESPKDSGSEVKESMVIARGCKCV